MIVFLNTTILQHQMLLCQNITIALVQFCESSSCKDIVIQIYIKSTMVVNREIF